MAETFIHPSAVVEKGAEIGAGSHIGPFCHIGPTAVIGEGAHFVSHVTVAGVTTIGPRAKAWPGTVIGGAPQSHRYKGEPTKLILGADAVIREAATLNTGTADGRGETIVGDKLYLMTGAHVGHDCIVGNNVTIANNAPLGGHVEVGDFVNIGGNAAVHQFVRIGHHAFIGGFVAAVGDVIPYAMVYPGEGSRGRLRGFNVVGLKRSGLGTKELARLRQAYRKLFEAETPLADNIEPVAAEYAGFKPVEDIIAFLTERGKRMYTMPARQAGASSVSEEG